MYPSQLVLALDVLSLVSCDEPQVPLPGSEDKTLEHRRGVEVLDGPGLGTSIGRHIILSDVVKNDDSADHDVVVATT